MIGANRNGRVWLYGTPVRMTLPFDALGRLVVERMGQEIASGDYYVFISPRRRQVCALQWDGTGFAIYRKHLGKQQCPAPWLCLRSDGLIRLTVKDVLLLLEGCEWIGRVSFAPVPPAVSRTGTNFPVP